MKHQNLTAKQIRMFKPEIFRELYEVKKMGGPEIAKFLGVGKSLVYNRLKLWGIKGRGHSERAKPKNQRER